MKKNKKYVTMLLAGAMLLSAFVSGCGEKKENIKETGSNQSEMVSDNSEQSDMTSTESGVTEITFPLSEEGITLKFMSATTTSITTKFSDMQVFKDYEELTNIHIDFTEIPSESWGEQVQLSLASGDYPDVYAGGVATIDSGLIKEYAEQGVIIPLNDLIDKYTVNIKKYLEENEELRKLCTMADGNIYSIPTLEENFNRTFIQLVINKTWLDQLGMDYPKTLDEFCDYLRAVKSTDMDGNGVLDEAGLSVIAADSSYLNYLMGSFGTLDTGNHLYITDDDDVLFSPITDEYREFLEYMHDMYAEGLIDPESFTQDQTQFQAKASSSSGVAASLQFLSISMGANPICDYDIAPILTNNEGYSEWPKNGVINDLYLNSFSITSANEHPIETIQWLDYWMDNGENGITMRYGTKGEYWDYMEDGEHWQVYGEHPVTGETLDASAVSKVSPQALVVPFWQFSDTFSYRYDDVDYVVEKRDTQEWYDPYLSNPYPTVYMSDDDSTELSSISMDLNNYINSQETLFITEGFTDDEWNAYVERCKELGCERYLEICTLYYEDYLTK